MLQRLSINLVQFFVAERIITEDDREVYLYSLEILLNNLVVYGSVFCLALLLQVMPATMVYYSGFLIIRHSAGGYHAQSHWQCIVLTLLTYLLAMAITALIPQALGTVAVVFMVALSLWGICVFAPVDHLNKPFTSQERSRYRQQSLVSVVGSSLICLVLVVFDVQAQWGLAGGLGMMSAAISVIVGSEGVKKNVQADSCQSR